MKNPSPAEIAELIAQGHDPQAIAELLLKRRSAAQQVCHVVEDAFTGVKLGRGIGLHEGQGLDDYAGAETCAAYRAKDEKEDWRRISVKALNACDSSLCFFDAPGMRFHLPAYLLADLRGDYHGIHLEGTLTRLSEYSISQLTLLSSKQRAAVRAYLLLIAADPEYELNRPHILRALAEFWTTE